MGAENGRGTAARGRVQSQTGIGNAAQSAQGPNRLKPWKERAAKARRAVQTARWTPNRAGVPDGDSSPSRAKHPAWAPRRSNKSAERRRRVAATRPSRSRRRGDSYRPRPYRSRHARGRRCRRNSSTTPRREPRKARASPVRSAGSPPARRPAGRRRQAWCENGSPPQTRRADDDCQRRSRPPPQVGQGSAARAPRRSRAQPARRFPAPRRAGGRPAAAACRPRDRWRIFRIRP